MEEIVSTMSQFVLFRHDYVLLIKGAVGSNITIKVLCGVMGDASLGEPYARYAAVARLLMDTFSIKCLDASFSNYLRDMTNTSWDGPAAGGGRYRNVLGKWRFCVYVCQSTLCFLFYNVTSITVIFIPGGFLVSFVGRLSEDRCSFLRGITVVTHNVNVSNFPASFDNNNVQQLLPSDQNVTQTGFVLSTGCGHSQHAKKAMFGMLLKGFF